MLTKHPTYAYDHPRPRTRLRRALQRSARGIWALVGVLALWWSAAAVTRSVVLPPPQHVLPRLWRLVFGGALLPDIAATVARTLAAVAIATVMATPLGIAAGRNRRVNAVAAPILYLLLPVPKIALVPVVLVVFGIGEVARIGIVVLVLFFQIAVAVRDAVAAVADDHRRTVIAMGGGTVDQIRYVDLPAALPALFGALRLAVGTALAVLFFAETFFARAGIGKFIMDQWMRAAYLDMTAGIVAIGAIGLALFSVLDAAEWVSCRHRRESAYTRGPAAQTDRRSVR